jgi:hypothetical protein
MLSRTSLIYIDASRAGLYEPLTRRYFESSDLCLLNVDLICFQGQDTFINVAHPSTSNLGQPALVNSRDALLDERGYLILQMPNG